MNAKILSSIILLILTNSLRATTTVDEEHEKFSNQYHSVIRESLSKVSSTFQGLDYEIQDGTYQMSWSHGSLPTLDFTFNILKKNEQVCHIKFVIDSFLAHVAEKLSEENSSAQIEAIKDQIRTCSENILKKTTGVTETQFDEELAKEGSDLLNKKDLNSEEQDEVKRTIINEEPEQVQQIWLTEPFKAIQTIEKTSEFVNNQDDLSSEEKKTLRQDLLDHPEKIVKELSEGQNFVEDSSEEEFANKDSDEKARKGIFIFSSSISYEQKGHVDHSEEPQNIQPINMFRYLHILHPEWFLPHDYDKIFKNIDLDHNESEEKVDDEVQTEENENYECQLIDKRMVKEKLKQLHLENQILDVKVFDENVVKCKRGKGLRIDVVLSFNQEECFIGLEGTMASGYKMISSFADGSFGIPLNQNTKSCVERFGTHSLKSKQK